MQQIGPTLWANIHILCMMAPKDLTEEQHAHYVNFLKSLAHLLPCKYCGQHFEDLLKENPVPFNDLFKWSVDIHNRVNVHMKKDIMSYEKANQIWSKYIAGKRCDKCTHGIDPVLVFKEAL